jgi:hypothetical protein
VVVTDKSFQNSISVRPRTKALPSIERYWRIVRASIARVAGRQDDCYRDAIMAPPGATAGCSMTLIYGKRHEQLSDGAD